MDQINKTTRFDQHNPSVKVTEFKTMGTKVKNIDTSILNQRLKIYGYQHVMGLLLLHC